VIGGGRAWVLGDNIDTDVLAPGAFMKIPLEEIARHCLAAVEAAFASNVRPGDILVAGRNFGIGSSREQAAEALKFLGVAAVLARSYGGIFRRNALNLGVPALVIGDAPVQPGDRIAVDPRAGIVHNLSTSTIFGCEPLPDFLVALLEDGGLMSHLQKRFALKERR
jgi:3-isopropylmalate/(R)-2-methylmalate dehydratase small subunit